MAFCGLMHNAFWYMLVWWKILASLEGYSAFYLPSLPKSVSHTPAVLHLSPSLNQRQETWGWTCLDSMNTFKLFDPIMEGRMANHGFLANCLHALA
jgi:hypothetical protein